MAKARAWTGLILSVLLLNGCLSHRLTGAQVLQRAQEALGDVGACHVVLDIEMDTDLLKDSLSVDLWESPPDRFRVQVLSAVNPQLRGLAFATDGDQSVSQSGQTHEVTVGPADLVKMPLVVRSLIQAWREWIQTADVQQTRVIARERESGLVVYKLEVSLVQDGYAQYWIDARQWWVRQVNYRDELLGTGTIRVREIECFDELPDAQFELEIPDGATITEVTMEDNPPLTLEEAQRAIGFPLRTPGYLPPGSEFVVAYQLDKNVALVYGGERSFTLVQGPYIGPVPQAKATPIALRGRQAAAISDQERGGVLLTWRDGELQFSLAGSLAQEELVRIAESLE